MAGKSKKYVKIRMTSKGKTEDGRSTGTFKVIRKNKANHKDKFKRMMFDNRAWNEKTGRVGVHVLFEEGGSLK